MSKNLVIVESPAKAKTIEKFLGKDFEVKSSYGHIRDLPSKGMNIDIEGGTFEPHYEISEDKKKVVSELKKSAKNSEVWLASDEDREGEAIAWHICAALKLDPKKTKRIVFHEITEEAITNAVKKPRTINKDLFDAQQARRILDRIVGYELSPILWKKIQIGLSAGRVQSVAVRLIVEREKEIDAFVPESSFVIEANFDLGNDKILVAKLAKKIAEKNSREFLEKCAGADFVISEIKKSPSKQNPSPPFTTSTLQQEASAKLGFSVKKTMIVAQKLYESGKITYMRTDSLNLSTQALTAAEKEIISQYGENFAKKRVYKTKNKGAQEAHEAIRPTKFSAHTVSGPADQKALYELIWRRTIASQMASAEIEKTTAKISISTTSDELVAKGEVVKFAGFLKVYNGGAQGDEKALPPLKKDQVLSLKDMTATETFSNHPPRYTEASLVKKLEEEGIGRPSTYAPTITTIQNRQYIEKETREGVDTKIKIFILEKNKVKEKTAQKIIGAEKSKLFPTDLGIVVTDFLVAHFPKIICYDFTRSVENDLDEIAEGKKKWQKIIHNFYNPFHATVEEAENISRDEAMGVRELGIDKKSGKPIIARIGRFGPMIQIGTKDDEEKPKFATIPKGEKMSEITLERALELFDLPREIGEVDGEKILANFGRFGPYIKVGKLFVSITPDDPFSIKLDRALELYEAKKKFEAEKYIKDFKDSDIQILNGRWGPYITDGKKNAKIPKEVSDPKKLTRSECEKILKEYKPRGRGRKKK